MKKYLKDGVMVVEVDDLGFLSERSGYGWLGREVRHFRLRRALRHAGSVQVPDEPTASALHKYYRFPTENITIIGENQQK